ncbi:MAG: hypothetical protein B6I20_06425 [Bacteroidetes bacterium 4572_117]|nr:MAG: hypothetical protein B6I20_06425 [Bacteroidetes bacterium 4572_117]
MEANNIQACINKGAIYGLLILIFLLRFNLSAQKSNIDDLIENKNFDKAIEVGVSLLADKPNNAGLNFKVGYSFMNTALRKSESIPYLEKAYEIYSKRKTNSKSAFETKFYLGMAYRKNYEFKKAIALLTELKKTSTNNELHNAIDNEILQCQNGEKLMKNPVKVQVTNLGVSLNSSYSDHCPIVSADESVMIFTSRREPSASKETGVDGQYNEDIYISYNENGKWQKPKSISININTEAHEASIGLSPDGQQLFIYSEVDNGTILTSFLRGDEWSKPKRLGGNINTRSRETHASLSVDGKFLYFTSDRPGGSGGLDIYVSEKNRDGTWGKAKNLGPSINTEFDEEGPFIHHDGITLYFSSKGHETMGGYDIFSASINGFGTWTKPQNLGYPVNTTDDDAFFAITADGKRAYFSSYREDGLGGSDIYMMALPEADEKPVTIVKGKVDACGSDINNVLITVCNSENDEIVGLYKPNTRSGKYLFVLPKGKNYSAIFEVNGQEKVIEDFFIGENADFQVIYKPISLLKGTPCEQVVASADTKQQQRNIDLFSVWDEAKGYTIIEDIVFRVNSSQCYNYRDNLAKLANYLKTNPDVKVEIVGYSDTQGPEAFNLKLSKKRAYVVTTQLIKFGVDKNQLSYRGDGIKNQISINNYKDGSYLWQSLPYNRRVEFKVSNDTNEKLKVTPVKIPVLYGLDSKSDEVKKELARLETVYTIQIGAYRKPVQRKVFAKIKNVQMYYSNKLYKYTTGEFNSFESAQKELLSVHNSGFDKAFIRKASEYLPNEISKLYSNPIDLKREFARLDTTYTIQLGVYRKPIQRTVYADVKIVQMYYVNKLYKYSTGEYNSIETAQEKLSNIRGLGYSKAYIRKVSEYYPNRFKNL